MRFACPGLLALMLGSSSAQAWDPYGHMVVCQLAYDRLNPKAKAAVDELVQGVKHPTQKYNFVTVGCWMDDIREDNPEIPFTGQFKPWHFITWGHNPSDTNPPLEPGTSAESAKGNIVIALKRAQAVLEGGTDPEIPDKSYALAILCHLVGDVHQPLHCASRHFKDQSGKIVNDRGGNSVTIDNAPPMQLPLGVTAPMNLHAFWDAAYRGRFDAKTGQMVVDNAYGDYTKKDMALLEPLFAGLDQFAPAVGVSLEPDFVAWAKESNALAREMAYAKLPRFEKDRYADVDASYTAEAKQIAQARLVLGGYRLASLLNATLGADPEN